MLIPCIIAGGAGMRLWPASREAMPKPFMRLPDGQSLLHKTFDRALNVDGVEQLLLVINRELVFRAHDEFRDFNNNGHRLDILLEPFGRNTAPAIVAAALHIAATYGDETQMLALPADHLVADLGAFSQAVKKARALADQGLLVTFGICPTRAETGFGYIQQGDALGDAGHQVTRFVEKPDLATARGYLDSGHYLWNSGMFCFRADAVLAQMRLHAPDLVAAVEQALESGRDMRGGDGWQRELDAERFAAVPDISIDYALMERSAEVAVVPCSMGWNDIGSWQAIRDLLPPDELGNRLRGETVLHDVQHCYIDAPDRVVGAVGLRNLIVVDTPDALLIAEADAAQDVKKIATELKRRGHDAYRLHRTADRPWGSYTVLEEGPRFKIKRIIVHPGASLSLQMHHHRSEHWIVVSGMARVVNGEGDFLLDTNESTFIAAGHRHRLHNPGVIDLVIIEVQSGEYLGEEDIVRFDDNYGRAVSSVAPDARPASSSSEH